MLHDLLWDEPDGVPDRPVRYDPRSVRLVQLRALRSRQLAAYDEGRHTEIDDLSRALGEEEIA